VSTRFTGNVSFIQLHRKRQLPPASQDTQLHPASQDTQLYPASQNTFLDPAPQDRQLNIASQGSQLHPASQDTLLDTASQDRQLYPTSQDRQLYPASEDTQLHRIRFLIQHHRIVILIQLHRIHSFIHLHRTHSLIRLHRILRFQDTHYDNFIYRGNKSHKNRFTQSSTAKTSCKGKSNSSLRIMGRILPTDASEKAIIIGRLKQLRSSGNNFVIWMKMSSKRHYPLELNTLYD